MSKIEITDSLCSVAVKMSEGNPGAVSVIMGLIKEGGVIDPQCAMGGLGLVLLLDTWGIYGPDIYVLFNDKCGRDYRKMVLLLRATQLGILPHHMLKELAADQMREKNLEDQDWANMETLVCAQLVDFSPAA